ncbi:DUF6427 family protein [Flavobacterium agricola]|uniref:DUF6427 family protein n=1 Tax=Flavobacterium agricola TaxID=2870839 RepID=A0ABY6M1B1_9FLAO|nr:DUF6427 family protein [Flavobacterium agricola]UYW00906.1 DUF6427 family protein [Flavobacterium agricola]
MITSIFNKTRPINYIILFVFLLIFFTLYQSLAVTTPLNFITGLQKAGSFLLLNASLFLMHFIYNRNNLVKDNMFGAFFSFLFCLLFPEIFNSPHIICALFLLVLAFRRLIALRSKLSIKQKLFDSCVLILIASLFYVWSALFLLLVFFVIMFQTSFDFKNWLIPFIALFIVGSIAIFFEMIFNTGYIFSLIESVSFSFNLHALANQSVTFFVLCFYALIIILFLFSSFVTSGSRSVNRTAVYHILYLILIISFIIFICMPTPNLAVASFSFFPLAIMGSNMIEKIEKAWIKESFLGGITVCILIFYFLQL